MGAFFICNKNNTHNIEPALDLFAEMGFSSPQSFEFGEWIIYAYPKMAASGSNIATKNDCTLISIGTAVYKGLDYCDSLTSLLMDYLSESIDFERLIGQYTLLFCCGDTINILRDPLGSKHLFTDKDYSMISSHMLPICQCFDGDLHINRKAFYEKFLTGIIMPPNTIFQEIIQIDKQAAQRITHERDGISFFKPADFIYSKRNAKTLKKCLAEQANILHDYFELLCSSGRNGIDLGLSGGYDSRLGLACLCRFYRGKLHLHSHATKNVHQADLAIANQLANYVCIPCHTVTTEKLSQCSHVDNILRKSILYFDGRRSFSIGGCGEVYTAEYRKESTESTPFTLTGVGGELYRNVFDLGFSNIRFDRFMEGRVFSLNFRKAISDELYREIRDDIINRAAARLGIDSWSKQSKVVAHRYYCEIMMPDGQGVALDAYNQVSCCVAPFLEPRIIAKGYEAVPFHHSGGEFEGKLVKLIDPELAAFPSSYGYPIGKRPIKAKIKERIRTYIPSSVWSRLAAFIKRKDSFCIESALNELYANSQTLKAAYSFMTGLFPEIDFTVLLRSDEDIREIQFSAMTLFYLKERLQLND